MREEKELREGRREDIYDRREEEKRARKMSDAKEGDIQEKRRE